METTRASVINSSALYLHDRAAERGLAFFEELLRDVHPRNFAIRLWDGSSLDAEPGQYARCTNGSSDNSGSPRYLGQCLLASAAARHRPPPLESTLDLRKNRLQTRTNLEASVT
jgi:hypothetical protein